MSNKNEWDVRHARSMMGMWVCVFGIVSAISIPMFITEWRNENTERITETERVNLCAASTDIVGCLEALGQ